MQKNKLRDPGVTELLRSAEEDLKPKQTIPPSVQMEHSQRLRRTKRLVPQVPALTPASQWQNDPIKQ